MSDFEVKDYSLFVLNGEYAKLISSNLSNNFDDVKKEVEQLCSDDVFAGPIADSVTSGWQKVMPSVESSLKKLKSVYPISFTMMSNYKNADTKNSNSIGSVK